MTHKEKFIKLLNEMNIEYDIFANNMVSVKNLWWVFKKDGTLSYIEDPDFFTRLYPKATREDITYH